MLERREPEFYFIENVWQAIQTQMNDLKSKTDTSNQNRLEELSAQLKEKEALIQKLEAMVKEAEVCEQVAEISTLVSHTSAVTRTLSLFCPAGAR